MSFLAQDVTIYGEVTTGNTIVRETALLTVWSTPEATTQSGSSYRSTTNTIKRTNGEGQMGTFIINTSQNLQPSGDRTFNLPGAVKM